jgi:ribosome-binding factor A
MSQGIRADRVGDQIRAEISEMVARELHDPGLGFLTITRVDVTADLQLARVYYSTLGDAKARLNTQRAFDRAAPFIRRQLSRRLRLRRAPELHFVFDESIEYQDRVERLLREIHEADHSPTPPRDDDDDQQP